MEKEKAPVPIWIFTFTHDRTCAIINFMRNEANFSGVECRGS